MLKWNNLQVFIVYWGSSLLNHSIWHTSIYLITTPPPSPWIYHNPKLSPFKNTLGALDGSHFICTPPLHSHASHQNQKGFMSQNCLFTCNFNFQFVFWYTRWEGLAMDAQVLEVGLKAGLNIPDSYYYLTDTGYPPSHNKLMTPYCGIRNHLAEWSRANQKWVNNICV